MSQQATSDSNGSEGAASTLDLIVVGGGPAGTAAAFRARELGLEALVIEYDDLMKRIRDYSKDKLILPSFGGGSKMKFPKGGDLVAGLHFAPIDKDEMVATWKAQYARNEIPVRVGLELTGLEQRDDGLLDVVAWDHGERCETRLRSRFVAIAIGRGVPRRFDLPGNTDGISYRLDDAGFHVGKPSVVVGGGTSAAEAVIAISNAKAGADDTSAVYWSYRGDRMPRVSKALAEVFFEAYVGNGNILYFPRSEPAAIVTGEDRTEYVAIRIDRRHMSGRPNESTYLEFAKEACIACIGEDIPESLLQGLGIHMRTGGPNHKRRMVVNRFLESEVANVFLIGDLLSQAYFETDDFAADPDGYREIKHRGNIKAALRDGVYIAEVIRQRLDGRSEVEVVLEDAEEPESEPDQVAALARPAERHDLPAASVDAQRTVSEAEAFLVRVLPSGVQEAEYPIEPHTMTTIGRSTSDLSFPSDTMLSDQHASISHGEDGYFLRDDGSATGTFLRVPFARKREIECEDLLRAGRQFLLVDGSPGAFELVHYDATGREVGRHPLGQGTVVLGRRAPDITLDADDGTLSRRQLALTVDGNRLFAKDLKSVNGTYLRVRSATRLDHGDVILVGQQTLAFSKREDAVLDTGHFVAAPPPQAAPEPAQPPEPVAAGDDGITVAFEGVEGTFTVRPGQTLCEVAEAHGLDITAECHSGICGSDPVRILSGGENLDAAHDQERDTLEEICELEPGPHRLACMVRLKGSARVEILKN